MIAVISDVHANAPALEAVLRDIRRRGVDDIYCLGDCVGYNAFPAETIEIFRKEGIRSVKGNHDMMATGELAIERCGPNGRFAMHWTRSLLSQVDLDFLRALPWQRRIGSDILLVHSRLNDAVSYLTGKNDIVAEHCAILAVDGIVRICFTGHTHQMRCMELSEDGVRALPPAKTTLDPARFYFIDPGSVGHPRHSDYRASYALFDPAARQVQWRRVAYDRARTSAGNLRHGIHTDLGPGLGRHAWQRFVRRCRTIARRIA